MNKGLGTEISNKMQSQQASVSFNKLHNMQKNFTEIKPKTQYFGYKRCNTCCHTTQICPFSCDKPKSPQLCHENSLEMSFSLLSIPWTVVGKKVLSCRNLSEICCFLFWWVFFACFNDF